MRPSTSRSRRYRPNWGDMQGLVISAYPHLEHAAYLLLSIREADQARRWLRTIRDRVTSAFDSPKSTGKEAESSSNVNIAFTKTGLERLCDSPSNFADPFAEGIHGRAHRTRILGDVGCSAPDKWRWGGTDEKRVDVLLMVFTASAESLAQEVTAIVSAAEGIHLVDGQLAVPLSEMRQREHFGFRDGISQPILSGSTDAERYPESIHLTALGEFVLGYPDASGRALGRQDRTGRVIPLPSVSGCPRFGLNGSYLVLRQLAQHVEAFGSAMTELTRRNGVDDPEAARRLAEKIVGRAVDGTPLVPYANVDDNEFRYAADPYGYGCPLGSHIRRANPRDSFENTTVPFEPRNDHRLLRRGRSYRRERNGCERDGTEKGLMFLCLNADIERQFEFIQQNWINNSSFLGLRDERDALIGSGAAGQNGAFTIPGRPSPLCIGPLPAFVTVVGGGYFFLPGLTALKWLADRA